MRASFYRESGGSPGRDSDFSAPRRAGLCQRPEDPQRQRRLKVLGALTRPRSPEYNTPGHHPFPGPGGSSAMLGVLLIVLLIAAGVAVLVAAGTLVVQGYLYSEPVGG